MRTKKLTSWMPALALSSMAAAASAQTVTTDPGASGTFLFSNLLIAGYNIIHANVGALSPATLVIATDDTNGTVTGNPGQVYNAGAAAPVNSITFNPNNSIASIVSSGGNYQTAITGPVSTGGTLEIQNLSYNPNGGVGGLGQIFADVSGTDVHGVTNLASVNEAVFDVDLLSYSTDGGTTWNSVSSPSAFQLSPGNYLIKATALTTSSATVYNQFIHVLGLKSVAVSTLKSINTIDLNPADTSTYNADGFGALTTSFTVTAVPEPSTYLTFGAGLLCLMGLSPRARSLRKA